jgi:serine/threonine protein kinase/tetratricopeptide (TPR) repeat protein
MTPERWQQIKVLLQDALETPPQQRSEFLAKACSDDSALRQEVESFLALGDEQARSSFLQSSTSHVALPRGTKLGEYEVQSLLGAGGMGEVYRAHDPRLRRDVAIKVLPTLISKDADRLRRFEQEAQATAALNHPNILAVHQMGTYEGAPYLVSELLEGETLREQLKRGHIATRKAIDYGVQIARGLAAAHEKGIVHRDLKPENLFVTKDGRVKILDFGLAKLFQPSSSSAPSAITLGDRTEPGLVMGTVGYMAPEQVRGEAADHRTDIFAFGAILYEMLMGQRAFQKPTAAETMTAILNEDPPGISQNTPNLPPGLQRVVHRCLEKNPEQRFQSASDLGFALEALSDSGTYSTQSLQHPSSRRGWLFRRIGLGVLTLTLLGAGFFVPYYVRSRSAEAVQIHSIAVLPFANASNDSEMEYLSEGLSEEITNSLARLPNLQVTARSIVSRYRSRQDDPQGVGRDLQVDAVLTGRVTEHGNELALEMELVSVGTGVQLWGQRYTRTAADVTSLQTALTREIASQLRPQLGGNERETLAKVGTTDAEAYRLYLRGRYHFEKWSHEDVKAATDLFGKAVVRDPNYAAAYAGLADAYVVEGYLGVVAGAEPFEKSRVAARRALALDNQIPESHLSLALVDYIYFWNFAEAEVEIQRALALDPKSAYAHVVSCWFEADMGRIGNMLSECQRALELEPFSPLYNFSLTLAYNFARDYNRAIEQAKKTFEIAPNSEFTLIWLGYTYERLGDYKQAMEQWVRLEELAGHDERAKKVMRTFQTSGYTGFLRDDAKDYEVQGDYNSAAADYAMLGEKDAAFAALERGFATRKHLLFIGVDPVFDGIRSDRRFSALLRRVGLLQRP